MTAALSAGERLLLREEHLLLLRAVPIRDLHLPARRLRSIHPEDRLLPTLTDREVHPAVAGPLPVQGVPDLRSRGAHIPTADPVRRPPIAPHHPAPKARRRHLLHPDPALRRKAADLPRHAATTDRRIPAVPEARLPNAAPPEVGREAQGPKNPKPTKSLGTPKNSRNGPIGKDAVPDLRLPRS